MNLFIDVHFLEIMCTFLDITFLCGNDAISEVVSTSLKSIQVASETVLSLRGGVLPVSAEDHNGDATDKADDSTPSSLDQTNPQWMHFAVLLSGVAIALINFIGPDDTVGIVAASCFTFTALLATAYSGGMFAYRVLRIRDRRAIDYHDKYGPTILTVVLIASVLINLILRLRQLYYSDEVEVPGPVEP